MERCLLPETDCTICHSQVSHLMSCDIQMTTSIHAYYRVQGDISCVRFCPFEDCLGIGHSGGFSSMIVPG